MADLYCEKCHKTMKDTNFYTYKNGQKTEMCKACMTMHVDNFNPETFFVLEFNAKPIINAATINCKEFPERKGATILGGIASVIISKIVRLPIELSPICVGKIPKCPGLNK